MQMDFRRSRPTRSLALSWLLMGLLAAGSGCAHAQPRPNLGNIYDEAAQAPDYLRNPVVVIPGVLGSRLVDDETGKIVWGKFDAFALLRRASADTVAIALPMSEGVSLRRLRDNVRSDGTLAYLEIDLAGVPLEIQAYDQILTTLGVGGYRDPEHPQAGQVEYGDDHFTCFQFDYDWRRDVAENAARLHEFLTARRHHIREEYYRRYGIVNADVKFDIVAHSMGGLVARYYLRYGPQPLPDDGSLPQLDWAGARNVARVVLVGTPNAGSALAIHDLVRGHRPAPMLPEYPSAVLGTMPAIYQLLPRPRHGALVDANDTGRKLDVYDPALWRDMQWGLADPKQDDVLQKLLPGVKDRAARLRIALDHQRKCLRKARQLHRALDVPAAPPPGVTLHLFAGDAIETPAVEAVDLQSGELHAVRSSPGDDSTTRTSAVMDERTGRSRGARLVSPIHWTSVMYLHTSHRGLTSDPIFADNVLALLLESPPEPPALASGMEGQTWGRFPNLPPTSSRVHGDAPNNKGRR